MAISGISNVYNSVYESMYLSSKSEKTKEDADTQKYSNVSEYYEYLKDKFSCLSDSDYKVTISPAFLEKCIKDPQKAELMEKCLSHLPIDHQNMTTFWSAQGAKVVNEEWIFDENGNCGGSTNMYVTNNHSQSSGGVQDKLSENKTKKHTPQDFYEKKKLLREQFEKNQAEKKQIKKQLEQRKEVKERTRQIKNLQKAESYSYQLDADRIKQRIEQAYKNDAANRHHNDSVDISEEGRSTLEEKIFAMKQLGQTEDIKTLSSGFNGAINDFEKVMSELGGGLVSDDLVTKDYSQASVDALKARFEKEEGTKTDTFDNYVNKMAAAYQLMKDHIEEKYAAADRPKEYYIAADGSTQEMTKEKELEMLDDAYENHSRFMAASTQVWSELQDFKVQITYSGNTKTQSSETKNQDTSVKEQAYSAFMSAICEENSELLRQQTGSLNHFRLNLGISSSAREILNGIWDYYTNLKQ